MWNCLWETFLYNNTYICLLVQFSCSVVSDSLQPHESQHARPPCPSPTPEFTQTHVHRVSDAIQPSHPLLPPSPALSLSHHQGLFQQVSSSRQVTNVLASICHEVMGLDAMIFIFRMLSFKPAFSLSSFTFTKRLFSSSLSAIRVVYLNQIVKFGFT